MSWLPQNKLTAEEEEKLKAIQQRKDALKGKYHTQIKSQTTAHETWIIHSLLTILERGFKSVRTIMRRR